MATRECDKRIVIVGAGSQSFGLGTIGDLMTIGQKLSGSTVVLLDLSEEMLKLVGGVFKLALQQASEDGDPAPFKMETTTDPVKALQDANYVVMTIEHGNRLKTWEQDYYIPFKHGCTPIYSENGGPGGAFHTWRQVPPMLKIADIMHDVAKGAYLLNYSNPVPRVTWAINRYMSKTDPTFYKRNVGLCHGITSGLSGLSKVIGVGEGMLDFTSAGLNHFYFFIKVKAKSNFTIPAIGPYPAKNVKAGDDLLQDIKERGQAWAAKEELYLIEELLRTFGYFTYPDQSHPGEYLHFAKHYAPHVKYGFKGTNDPYKQRLIKSVAGELDNFWWVHGTNERAVPIMVGIEHDTKQVEIALNMQNDGCISNLPSDCTVEAPGHVDKHGPKHDKVGAMPRGIANLLQHEATIQDLVVEAAITGDYNVAVQALSVDPTVPSPQVARNVLDEMLLLQKEYLVQFQKKK
jgi:alpha-galactosidase